MTQPINLTTKPKRKLMTSRQAKRRANLIKKLTALDREILYYNPSAANAMYPKAKDMKPCSELIEEYMALTSSQLAESTQVDKRRALKVFSDWLGPRPFSREAVELYAKELHDIDWADGTKWYMGRALSTFLLWLFDTKRIPDDWHRGVRFPKQPTQKPRENYTKEEIERLIEAAEDRPIGFLIRLGYHTGMALTDCANLTWDSVDMDKGIIRKPRQKTGVECIITFDFGSPMRAALEAQYQDTLRAFGKTAGMPVCRWAFNNKVSMAIMFRRLCEKAGVKYRSFHSLRATMISELGHSDAPLAVSMSVVGLKNPSQFLSYITPQPEKIREQMRRLRA